MKLQIREILNRPISEIIKARTVVQCGPDTSIADAIQMIRQKHVGSIVITDGLQVQGIFTERDFIEKVGLDEQDPFSTPISEFMTTKPVCIARQETLGSVLMRMRQGKFRHILIVDAYQNLENVVSLREIMDYALAAAGEFLEDGATKKAA